jgi:hypothetical protein
MGVIGNAVAVEVAARLGRRLLEHCGLHGSARRSRRRATMPCRTA